MKNIILLLLLPLRLFSQNLVINPSFEDTVSLNQFDIHYNICQNWVNPNPSTTDFFSPYCQELGWGNGYCSPNTWLGFQLPQDGLSFIGLVIYENNSPTKEYAQGFLIEPMVAEKTYNVSMYINLADNTEYKICEIEIAFTNTLNYTNVLGSFNFSDTVKFNINNSDTISWLHLTSTYKAIGGEKYIYIGSQTLNQNILCVDSVGYYPLNAAYYFIDNISITENEEIIVSNIFTPNNDGLNDIFKTEGLRESDTIQIYNRWGIKVYETNGNAAWDGKNSYGQNCSEGIYYYAIQSLQNKTGFLHLITNQ